MALWFEQKAPDMAKGWWEFYNAAEGEGKLIIESKSKPKTNSGTITELAKNRYQLTVKPNVNYQISYKAI